ncbi:XK-related protein 8 [Eleutherodactylus coqui]|uniref:XK-related protein 8 n=1 Tax=Eleutherodactylus coqui TaxID=57060 RepID=UPI003461E671
MPGCLPDRYRLLDLLFTVWGAAAFLVDLGSDVWSAVRYYRAGDPAWAALFLGLYLLSSSVLQLLSWGWFWVDWQDWYTELESTNAGSARDAAGGVQCAITQSGGDMRLAGGRPEPAAVVDAVPLQKAKPGLCAASNGNTETPPGTATTAGGPGDIPALDADTTGGRCGEDELLARRFYTGRIIFHPPCFTLLHVLQLGYPLRCLHSLEVSIAAYRNPEDDQFKDYAYFLTHDISMMRLVETFLENTPQLILVLYIILQREAIEPFQCFSISMSFICISWAILDYHQSLRLFLREKLKLSNLSSAIYYLWNFCLISSRILCITLFTVTFHWRIALHFLLLWLPFFLWAMLQKTSFMKHKFLETVYRATVAIILYFSWFNVADGRTIYRCIFYHLFILTDNVILVESWRNLKFPSNLDVYETHIIVTNIILMFLGLFLRLIYYKFLHPNVLSETKQYFDVPDGIKRTETDKLYLASKIGQQTNHRIQYLAWQIY